MGIKVNKLSSTKTQLPYDYYSLPFCKPPTIVNSAENLGEASLSRAAQCLWRSTSRARYTQVLRGDRIENSVYTVRRAANALRSPLTPAFPTIAVDARGRVLQRQLHGRPAERGGCRCVPRED